MNVILNGMFKKIAHNFLQGEYAADLNGKVWTEAFEYILQNTDTLHFSKSDIHTVWTVNGGHLRRKVKDDQLILQILKLSLPKYEGKDLILYRGECQFLYEQNNIGFCWTPDISVAKKYAKGLNAQKSGGVLLKTYAPKKAILSSPNDHSIRQMKEFEYTCDPTALPNIEVLEYFKKHQWMKTQDQEKNGNK